MTELISTDLDATATQDEVITAPEAVIDRDDPLFKMAWLAAEAADDRKGGDILLLQVGVVSSIAEYFVIVTGYSRVQVRAITNAVDDKIKEVLGRDPIRSAGTAEGIWSCLDYGDVVVHIQMPDTREFYGLEAFWGHSPRAVFESEIPTD
ncbi:MAG: ribosome silencing factor [Cyanobacteria bacterium]|jgi:ribosome-associated protein|nr:ribosome silencing factor [Cyanobacteriota bacterium]